MHIKWKNTYIITWLTLLIHHLTHYILFNGLEVEIYLNPSLTFKTCGNLELLQEWTCQQEKKISL